MIPEIGHQIGRYRKTEALKTKMNTSRQGRTDRVADHPDTIWPLFGIIACSTSSAALLEQKVQRSSDSQSSNH